MRADRQPGQRQQAGERQQRPRQAGSSIPAASAAANRLAAWPEGKDW